MAHTRLERSPSASVSTFRSSPVEEVWRRPWSVAIQTDLSCAWRRSVAGP